MGKLFKVLSGFAMVAVMSIGMIAGGADQAEAASNLRVTSQYCTPYSSYAKCTSKVAMTASYPGESKTVYVDVKEGYYTGGEGISSHTLITNKTVTLTYNYSTGRLEGSYTRNSYFDPTPSGGNPDSRYMYFEWSDTTHYLDADSFKTTYY